MTAYISLLYMTKLEALCWDSEGEHCGIKVCFFFAFVKNGPLTGKGKKVIPWYSEKHIKSNIQ